MNTKLTTLLAIPLFLPGIARGPIGASPLHAQDPWRAQVQARLAAGGVVLSDRGYELTHEIHVGALREGRSRTVTFLLQAGTEYRIVGVCDEDCGDLDLRLYDENDHRIDSDLLLDATPVVGARPRWTGGFRVEVDMVRCRLEPCRYGLAVFGR